MIKHVEKRATLDHQKKEIVTRILEVWQENPHLRLSQLLSNAVKDYLIQHNSMSFFYLEDYDLLECLNKFATQVNPPIDPQITIQINRK